MRARAVARASRDAVRWRCRRGRRGSRAWRGGRWRRRNLRRSVGRERLQIGEGECVELEVLFEAEADGVADDLVGFAEGDAFVGEVGGGGHGVEVAGFGGGLHALR